MVQLIKKRIYKPDKSYTYNFYKIVGNKKKKISSKRYHEYMNRIKQKKKNNIPLILIKGGNNSIQYGGLKETALNAARDMVDLRKRLRKYKNNPSLNLSNAYIVKHGITHNPEDDSLKINVETEKKIKQLLKLSDFEFSTKFIYMDDENGNSKKYMVIIPTKDSVKTIQSYIENSFGTDNYNKFKIMDNEGVITPQATNEYFDDKDPKTNRRINHKEKVDNQIKKFDVLTSALGHYINFLQSLNNLLGTKLDKIITANNAFFKKNVDALDTQVIFALITGAFAEPEKRGFYRTPNPVRYDIGEFRQNYKAYTDTMTDHDYKEFARFIRATLDNVEEFQTNSKWYDPINNIDIGTINEYNWEEYVSKFDAYRTYLRKTFVSGVGKIQCGVIKILDSYFELVNERASTIGRQFKSIKSKDIFKLQPSQLCLNIQQGGKIQKGGSADANLNLIGVNKDAQLNQDLNKQLDLILPGSNIVEKVEEKVDQVIEKGEETQNIKKALSEHEKEKLKSLPNENIYYDVFRGFRKDDGFNPAKFVDFIQQILQYEISMLEIKKLKELNDKFEERLENIITEHKSNKSKADNRKNSYLIECKKFTTILEDKDISVMIRLNKLKEYKEYIKKTAVDNIEHQQKLEKAYATFNFDIESLMSNNINLEIEVVKQVLNTPRNDTTEPDYKKFSSGLINLRKKYKSKFSPEKKEDGEAIKVYRFLEFYAIIFKKLVIQKTETCALYSAFNFEQIANCIHEMPSKMYKNYPKVQLVDMPQRIVDAQQKAGNKIFKYGTFGYPFMLDMYKKYKDIHPFFYDEAEACINELKKWIEDDKEKQDKVTGLHLGDLKVRKEEWEKELHALKLETLMEQKRNEENLKQKALEITAKRAAAEQARQKHKEEIAEQAQEYDIQVVPSKDAPVRNFRISTLERQIKEANKQIENFEASKAITETGLAMDKANKIQTGGLFESDLALKYVKYTSDLDNVITLDKDQVDDSKKQVQNYMLNQRVFLSKDKYANLSYIYLLNASCRDFNPTSRIWQSTKNAVDLQIDVGFANNLHVKAPKKELLTSNFGKKFDSGTELEQNLEECAEYRLRYPRAKDRDFYYDILEKKRGELNSVERLTSNAYTSDILDKHDMWTIQKNVSVAINFGSDIEENQWLDLAEIKIKAPKKLSTLDNMILNNNPMRRKRALKSLIKYVSWPDIPDNYNPINENPFGPDSDEKPPNHEDISLNENEEIVYDYKTNRPIKNSNF